MPRVRMQIADQRNTRGQGAIVGLVVASVFVAAGLQILFGEREGSGRLFLMQGIPTLFAGLFGGWLLAPRAARSSTRQEWFGVVLRLGCVAVVVGAIGVGIALGVDSALRSEANVIQFIVTSIGGGLMLAAIGIVVMGWSILPITALAAAIWAFVMARLLRRAPARAR